MQSSWADNSAADQLAASTSNTSTANNNITNYSTVTSGDSASSRPAGPARSTYIPPHLRRTHQTSTDSKPHPEPISAPPPSAAPPLRGAWSGNRNYQGGRTSASGFSSGSNVSANSIGTDGWPRRSAYEGGGRHREENPFANDEVADESLFQQENTGINFDAYEDIPVETSGENVPPPVNTFAEIDLGPVLSENIRRCKYVKPTPVQRHAIPISLAGRDLMACAQTGSGKTAAFCFPIIAGILASPPQSSRLPRGSRTAFPLALILAPTRELSMQV